MQNLFEVRHEIVDKTQIPLHDNFIELAILVFQDNVGQESEISDHVLASYIIRYSGIVFIQLMLLFMMINDIQT